MRADGDFDAAVGEFGFGFVFGFFTQTAKKADNFNAQRFEPLFKFNKMLFGKDFSGRHYSHLRTGFDSRQSRQSSHNGFAAADIALQQAVHRVGLRHIAADFGNNFFLRIGQGKRQGLAQGLGQCAVAAQCRRRAADTLLSRQAHRKLLRQKFIEFEPLPCRQRAV
ncbi:hypothetical protein NM1476_2203 [Neisseria meningitidis NM1476]|nr:hypothetical protein NM1476_2203 [Neisseria meningitidis NM1476]CWT61261.1 Uncharacterised protein [Neisseria meningitidis]